MVAGRILEKKLGTGQRRRVFLVGGDGIQSGISAASSSHADRLDLSVYRREEKLVCEVVRDLTNEPGIDVERLVQPVRVIGAEECAAQLAAGEIHNRPVGHVRRC